MEDIVTRLVILRGNTPDVSPANTPAQFLVLLLEKNEERFQNSQIREREREISNIPKGIVNKGKSSTNSKFPDTSSPPPLPPPPPSKKSKTQKSNRREFDNDEDFPPPPDFFEPTTPRETRFLFSVGSLSPLRNKLQNIATLPSKPTIDNFERQSHK